MVPVRLMCEAHQCVFGRRQEERDGSQGLQVVLTMGPGLYCSLHHCQSKQKLSQTSRNIILVYESLQCGNKITKRKISIHLDL